MLELIRAVPEDAIAINALKIRAFTKEFECYGPCSKWPGYDSIERQVQVIDEQMYYKVIKDDELVGGVCVVDIGEGKYVLSSIFIESDLQNQGIGTVVMQLILSKFPQAQQWVLDTPYLSYLNHHFYEKFGFQKVGEFVPERAKGTEFRLFKYEKKVAD